MRQAGLGRVPDLQRPRDLRAQEPGQPGLHPGLALRLGLAHLQQPRQIVSSHVLGHDEGGGEIV